MSPSFSPTTARAIEAIIGGGLGASAGALVGRKVAPVDSPTEWVDEQGLIQSRKLSQSERLARRRSTEIGAAIGGLLGGGAGPGASVLRQYLISKSERAAIPAMKAKYLSRMEMAAERERGRLEGAKEQIAHRSAAGNPNVDLIAGQPSEANLERILRTLREQSAKIEELATTAEQERSRRLFGGAPIRTLSRGGQWQHKLPDGTIVRSPNVYTTHEGQLVRHFGAKNLKWDTVEGVPRHGPVVNWEHLMPEKISAATEAAFWDELEKISKELTTAGREKIKEKNFALPGRRYPINDPAHARNALARVSQHGSPAEKAAVRSKVHKKFPGIGEGSEKQALQLPSNKDVIQILNDVLGDQFTAISQYIVQSELLENWGYKALAAELKQRAMGEMKHAEQHIERIVFLEGVPDIKLKEIRVGSSVPEMLQNDLKSEKEAIDKYNKAILACVQLGDGGTRKYLEAVVVDEEAHHDRTQALLGQIKDVGLQNFLAEQTKTASEVGHARLVKSAHCGNPHRVRMVKKAGLKETAIWRFITGGGRAVAPEAALTAGREVAEGRLARGVSQLAEQAGAAPIATAPAAVVRRPVLARAATPPPPPARTPTPGIEYVEGNPALMGAGTFRGAPRVRTVTTAAAPGIAPGTREQIAATLRARQGQGVAGLSEREIWGR